MDIIDKDSFARSQEAQNWTQAMEMEIILSVISLVMTFLCSLSTLLDLQKIEEMEKGDDIEICSSEKPMDGVMNLTDEKVIEVPDEGPTEKSMDSAIDKPKPH